MNAEDYHKPLQPLMEACRLAKTGWVCLPNPLVGVGKERGVLWRGAVLLRHIGLVFRCWRVCRRPHILVREFSTVPLLLIFPLLWPLRRKLFFVMHHNLQWALRSRIEGFALAALARTGARWVVFETQNIEGMTRFYLPSSRNLILPHPVPEKRDGEKKERPVIGVAGYWRPEKKSGELLTRLTAAFPDGDLVMGAAEPERIPDLPARVRLLDTATDEAYRRMLAGCDVLVQNGAAESYFYRVSGPVADAAACGTAVVVPDFPFLRHQISSPVRVGETFRTPDELPAAVRRAIERVRSGGYDFESYCEARTAKAVAAQLDDFSDNQPW